MKRILLFTFLVISIAALAFAQDRGVERRGRGFPPGPPPAPPEKAAVTGALTIVQGFLAVKDGDTTYYAAGLERYIGFIDSLKDGATATLEGFAAPVPWNDKAKILRVNKLTIGGKDYDLGPAVADGFRQPGGRSKNCPHGWGRGRF
ncbi:MAG: hypothetical protein LBT16_13685 [Treponema sp.]|jgi:hypothetical protein|nr:hypothetical protein [Treponema sp.]